MMIPTTPKQQWICLGVVQLFVVVLLCCNNNLPNVSSFTPVVRQQQQQQRRYGPPSVSLLTPASTILFMQKDKNKKSSSKGGFGSASSSSKTTTTTSASASRSTFPYSGTVRPGTQSPQRVVVDESIVKPDYWQTGVPSGGRKMMLPWMIEVKSAEEISKMKLAGRLARHILDTAGQLVRPGITTDEIDAYVHNEIIRNQAYPSPLNYHNFPKSCCTSVNEVICHGIPDDRPLQEGDIINLDITVYLNGYHGDCSEMFVVGNTIRDDVKDLLQTTYDCWISACSIVKPGLDYKEIGAVIEDYIVPRGYTTVKQFCGHGIGAVFHTTPNILHYRNNEPHGQMAAGHTFTIEPMICAGKAKALTWPDQWTATTVDGKNSAQFEHTLLITADGGVEALTGKNENSPVQFWELETKIHPPGIWLGTSQYAVAEMKRINAKLDVSNQS